LRLARGLLLVALLTGCALALRLNPASAGFLLLVGVLLIASRQPLVVASGAAVAATLAYNFFFFPPKHTLAIDDPENWIALLAFLLTSLLANRLLVRERQQAEKARASHEEIEALYEMSVALLKGAGGVEQIGDAASRYLVRVGAASGGVILFASSPQQQRVLSWTGAPMSDEVEDIAAGVGRHGRTTDIPSPFGRDVCVPLTAGGRVRAVLLARGAKQTQTALDSAANLLSFAIEREQFTSERARVEALGQANELKSSLLQAVSHDLKSPLTVLGVESEALERSGAVAEGATGHVRTIRDEVGRLHRRIDNLLSLARFEAGIVSPRTEPTPPADLFRAAREALPTITADRAIRTTVADETRDLLVDPSLALEIVINLIENADDASPPDTPIELRALPSAEVEGRVWVEVADRGPGLTPELARRVRAIGAPRVEGGRGLGIELARTLASLSGGSVEWFEREGGGTVARLDLPAARLAAAEAT
jgi:two-component system sensor histidine kinase KdpD